VETVVLPVLLVALVQKFTDLVAFVTAKDWKAVAKQVLAWAAGAAAVYLFKGADLANGYVIAGFEKAIGDLNAFAIILLGMSVASGGGVLRDFINSRDNNSSAYVPPLGGEKPPA
jgi:uncharacterized membrane protein YeiH